MQSQNSRTYIYGAMILLVVIILFAAFQNAPPIYLAVGFIGEIILGATAHLSSMIERLNSPRTG